MSNIVKPGHCATLSSAVAAGWRFNGEGACTHIPQAYDADMEQRAISNSKSCVKRFPAQVGAGAIASISSKSCMKR